MITSGSILNAALRSWQLGLLASTSVVLSIASGWTTWDGMRNFTGGATLALMITFGIQGVMLVLSWLIGSRLSEFLHPGARRTAASPNLAPREKLMISILQTIIILSFGLLFTSLYLTYIFEANRYIPSPLTAFVDLRALFAILFLSSLILAFLKYRDAITEYTLQASNFTMRNIVPIAMLTACAFASVFFSFDSLFSSIMPQEERQRMAQLRSSSETSQILNDIADTATARKTASAQALLATPQWSAFMLQLTQLDGHLQKVPVQAQENWDETRQRSINETANRAKYTEKLKLSLNRSRLAQTRLTDRLKENRQSISRIDQDIAGFDRQLRELEKQIVSKAVALDGEERGLGTSGLAGRGPQYRRIASELALQEARRDNLLLQRQRFAERRDALQNRLIAMETQFAATSAEVQKLNTQLTQTTEIQASANGFSSPRDIAAAAEQQTSQLSRALWDFKNRPTPEYLANLQTTCTRAQDFLKLSQAASAPPLQVSCDTSAVQKAALQTFAVHRDAAAFQQRCMAKNSETSSLVFADRIVFVRDCLDFAGLRPSESSDIVQRIDRLERERDDKAHRFVVTTNAFLDGNKLAFLALAIALAIDALVLASGFLGAMANRSPLAGSDLAPEHSTEQREAIMQAALLPDIAINARAALEAIQPLKHGHEQDNNTGDWTHRLNLTAADSSNPQTAATLSKIANAAATIGAARRIDDASTLIHIKPQLVDYLSRVSQATSHLGDNDQELRIRAALSKALGPNAALHAQTLLEYLRPSVSEQGFSSEIDQNGIEAKHKDITRACLNAASAFGLLKQPDHSQAHIIMSKPELYFALLHLSQAASSDDHAVHRVYANTSAYQPKKQSHVQQGTPAPYKYSTRKADPDVSESKVSAGVAQAAPSSMKNGKASHHMP